MFKVILFVLLIVVLIWYWFYITSESYNDYETPNIPEGGNDDWQEFQDYSPPIKKQGTFIDPMDDLFVIKVVAIKQSPSFTNVEETKRIAESKVSKDTLALIE